MEHEEIRKAVRERYGHVACGSGSCCSQSTSRCGGGDATAHRISRAIGYSDEDMESVPEGANLGLGCGNPVALASLKAGETVLDLGAGAGFDCFLAARNVGAQGKVIGVDMTPEMLGRARENAARGGYGNVEFRLGEIENLPLADDSVDVVISNCVINLSPDKRRVFQETYRVLKPGGRCMVSDIVLVRELPEPIRNSRQAYVGCVAGALMKDEYLEALKEAGFQEVEVVDESVFSVESITGGPASPATMKGSGVSVNQIQDIDDSVLSIRVHASKPR